MLAASTAAVLCVLPLLLLLLPQRLPLHRAIADRRAAAAAGGGGGIGGLLTMLLFAILHACARSSHGPRGSAAAAARDKCTRTRKYLHNNLRQLCLRSQISYSEAFAHMHALAQPAVAASQRGDSGAAAAVARIASHRHGAG